MRIINRLFFMIVCIALMLFIFMFFDDIKMFFFANEMNNKEIVNQQFQKESQYRYHYSKCNEDEKVVYRHLYYAFVNHDEEIETKSIDKSQISQVYNRILDDHPEIYYIQKIAYSQKRTTLLFKIQYRYNKEEVENYNQKLSQETSKIIQKARQEKDKILQIKLIYDYLIDTVSYQNHTNDQNIISALLDHQSVCSGYARSYQYLLKQIGIESAYMSGEALQGESNSHAWLMIYLYNDYYYSDVTWGDHSGNMEHACYAYFLMNSDDMLRSYQPDSYYEKTIKNQINYYQNIGCYMTKYDYDLVGQAVKKAKHNKVHVIEIKCANDQVYQTLKDKAENTYLIYNVLTEYHCYDKKSLYSYNEQQRIIEFSY